MHFNTIVQGQYCPFMFLIRNIFFGPGLYPTPTVIATGRNWSGELRGCTSTQVLHLAEESVMEFCSSSSSETDCCEWRRWRLYKVTGHDFFRICGTFHIYSPVLTFFLCLSCFYLAVPMRGCLGKHSCMSSPFPIAILNETCSLRALILFCGDLPAIKN